MCSTDCINQRGELGKVPPTILGHASIGVVEAIGADVTHVEVGDRVLVPGTPKCGHSSTAPRADPTSARSSST